MRAMVAYRMLASCSCSMLSSPRPSASLAICARFCGGAQKSGMEQGEKQTTSDFHENTRENLH
jgi:hypothetical protein